MDLSYLRENWTNKMKGDTAASIAAWDSVAEDYINDGSTAPAHDAFLRVLLEKVPLSKDMAVLDVGCGAGAYGIALAEKVGRVVGVDFSPGMLAAGRRCARERGISNIEFLERDWWSCDGEEFRGGYDLVFAHTTPAIADHASFTKMAEASRRWCALCRPSRRRDQVSDVIRAMAGLKSQSPDDPVAYAFSAAWAMGGRPELSYHDTVWSSSRPFEEAKRWYLNRLKGSCRVEPDTERRICGYLEEISVDGLVRETINTTLVTMIWEVAP